MDADVEPEPCRDCGTPVFPNDGWCQGCHRLLALESECAHLRSLAYEALHVIENLRENGPEQGDGFWDETGSGGWKPAEDVMERLRLVVATDLMF